MLHKSADLLYRRFRTKPDHRYIGTFTETIQCLRDLHQARCAVGFAIGNMLRTGSFQNSSRRHDPFFANLNPREFLSMCNEQLLHNPLMRFEKPSAGWLAAGGVAVHIVTWTYCPQSFIR